MLFVDFGYFRSNLIVNSLAQFISRYDFNRNDHGMTAQRCLYQHRPRYLIKTMCGFTSVRCSYRCCLRGAMLASPRPPWLNVIRLDGILSFRYSSLRPHPSSFSCLSAAGLAFNKPTNCTKSSGNNFPRFNPEDVT